jgi:hypothetical protein
MRLLSRHSPAGLAALLLASLPGVPAIPGMPLVPEVAGQEARAGDPGPPPGRPITGTANQTGTGTVCAGDPGGASSPAFRGGLQVGSEAERYLRVLQVAGLTSPYPWSLRGFSPREAERVLPSPATLHPWQESWSSPGSGRGRGRLGWVEPEIGILFNSTIPSGENDGALWAGKGFTTLARAGAWARLGPFHLRLAPEVFWTQNASFRLAPNGRTGEEALRDPRFPGDIDHPQRFGGWEYTRLDPGFSALHLELPLLTVGASGASQWWGPSLHYPLMLGNNAGGFPHAFVQTGGPLNLGLARLHARILGGRLDQSPYSPVQEGETRRFISGALLVLTPRGLPGLEVGAHRMAGTVWPEGGIGWAEVGRPFRDVVGSLGEGREPRQRASSGGSVLPVGLPGGGVRGVCRGPPGGLRQGSPPLHRGTRRSHGPGLRLPAGLGPAGGKPGGPQGRGGELRAPPLGTEDRSRDGSTDPRPLPRYIHSGVRQGHTQHGQILGSPTAYGGSGWTLGVDRYGRRGRWSVDVSRALRLDWLPTVPGPAEVNRAEVGYTMRVEGVWRLGGVEWGAAAAPSWHLNRNLARGRDLFNMKMELWGRGLPR